MHTASKQPRPSVRGALRGPVVLFLASTALASAAGAQPASPIPPAPASIPAVDAIVDVPDFGEFRIRFLSEEAPNHVAHFLTLVDEGFYDGMSFHRIIPHFLVQVGNPDTREEPLETDRGPASYRLPPEPSERSLMRGSVVMAWRGPEPGTAAAQWFVMLGDFPELKQGTVIGEVVEGLDVVDRVSQVSTFRDRSPLRRVPIRQIRLVESTANVAMNRTAPRAEAGDDSDGGY